MTRRLPMLAILLCLLGGRATPALAVPPADAIFVQAEDFATDGKAWVVKEQTDPYAPDSGLKHLWGPTGGPGTATREVDIPAAGRYTVWVRYTVMAAGPPSQRGALALAVRQGDRKLSEGRFDEQPPEQDPGYVHRYNWGKFEADLTAGKATLELSKLAPIDCSGWTRYVDCVLLTTDAAYAPNLADFQPKTWLRVTLGPNQTTPIYIHCFADHFRDPWYMHFALSKDGFEIGVGPRRGKAVYLAAGESTPWCDITPAVHEDRGARLELRGAEAYSYTRWLPSFDATFEFATAPVESAIVKRITRQGPGAGLEIIVPGLPSKATADKIRTDDEYCAENTALARKLPAVGFGRRPRKFPLFLGMSMRSELFRPEIRQAEYRIAAALGFNGTGDALDPLMASLGFCQTHSGTESWFLRNGCYGQPETEKIKAGIERSVKAWGASPPPAYLMAMDEPAANSLEHCAACEGCRTAFRAWLKDDRRLTPEALGAQSWDEVKPATGADKGQQPALYYYSQLFRQKTFADFLRLQTDEIARQWPGSPPVTVNFSDGAVYEANMYLLADYYEVFRTRALSLAWSEDWSNIASTYQCCGYNAELLRSATMDHRQPLGMYLITSYGRTPLDVKLKAYSSLGRGVSMLCCYYYGPTYVTHEGNWYLKRDMYQPVTELAHEIGGAEDLLTRARRVRSQVAFLYSRASDLWTMGDDDLYGHERMHAYLALTHAQVPVDFLSEEDVAEGRLKDYKALYVFGPNLLASAAKPLGAWVKAGGVLYLSAGAAVADELNRPARPLDQALGFGRGEVVTLQRHVGPGRYLTSLKVQGTVSLGKGSLDILGTKQALNAPASQPPRGAETIARFADGGVAAESLPSGRGKVFLCGTMPGLSYIRKALALRDALGSPAPRPDDRLAFDTLGSFSNLKPNELSYNPWEYPAPERDLLLRPVQAAKIVAPVVLDKPVVESFYLEAPQGAVVTLANYTLRPIPSLSVTVRVPRRVKRVESVRGGALKFSASAGTVTAKVPLRDTDMLKLYW